MRTLILALILLAQVATAQTPRHRPTVPPSVPAAYLDLYSQLAAQLASAEAQLSPLHPENAPPPVYAAELLPANSNRGTDLLQPGAMAGVRAYLDRLQQAGIGGVVFPVGYPLLIDRFPGSAQYLDFYRQVMAEVRRRSLTVEIESSVMFASSPFSKIQWDYSKTSFSDYLKERHDMTATIVQELAPDYLDLGAEPDTEAKLTGYSQLNVPSVWADQVGQIVAGISRGATKIGAGIGTWSSVAFVGAECAQPLDFIALHIYPIDGGSVTRAFQAAAAARACGKAVVIDEAWLYKSRPGEISDIASNAAVFGRDAYGFFAPLDQQFLRLLDDFARAEGVKLVSPFWSVYLFAYLPYNGATSSLSYAEIVQRVNAAAVQNIVSGDYSTTGNYYRFLINGGR